MRNFLRLAMAAMGLVMILGSAVYAAPPSYGTVDGDTWTVTLPTSPELTYSISPVPGTKELGSEELLSLALESVLTISTTGVELEVYTITDFDYTEMGEHVTEGPIFTGRAYTFNKPGQYSIWFKSGSNYLTVCTVEVHEEE